MQKVTTQQVTIQPATIQQAYTTGVRIQPTKVTGDSTGDDSTGDEYSRNKPATIQQAATQQGRFRRRYNRRRFNRDDGDDAGEATQRGLIQHDDTTDLANEGDSTGDDIYHDLEKVPMIQNGDSISTSLAEELNAQLVAIQQIVSEARIQQVIRRRYNRWRLNRRRYNRWRLNR